MCRTIQFEPDWILRKEKQTAKANTFMFNKLVIGISVKCYILKSRQSKAACGYW